MKLRILTLVLMVLSGGSILLQAQTLSPYVTPAQGGYDSVGGVGTLSWTLGETFTPTLIADTEMLSQGFEQPEVQITTGAISGGPFCADGAISIPFTSDGYVDPANVFTAQLSNSSGSFASPVVLGTLSGDTISGTITGAIPYGTASGSGYLVRVVGSTPVFTGIVSPTTLTIAQCNNTWKGTTTDWFTNSNWSTGNYPSTCSDGIIIPSGLTNYPVLTADASVGSVTIAGGAKIELQGNTLSVCSTWSGPGSGADSVTSNTGTGILILNGTSAQTLSGNSYIYELKLNNTAGASLLSNAKVEIANALDLEVGTLTTTGATLTLLSTDTNQAAIIDNFSAGNSGTINGNVTAQRFYGAADYGYTNQHMLGLPVTGVNLSVLGAGGVSGYIIPTPSCSELQIASGSPYGNVFSYNQINGATCGMAQWYVEPGSAVANEGQGYSVILNGTGTLSVTGPPNLTSTNPATVTNSGWAGNTTADGHTMTPGWQLVSNPYSATLKISSVDEGVGSEVQVWQADGSMTGTYQPGMVGSSAVIAPFQAYMVHVSAPGSTTYTINATDRVRTAQSFYALNDNELDITAENLNNYLLDKTVVAFNSNATDTFDTKYDAHKLAGLLNRHTLYTLNNGKWMGINTLNSVATTSTVSMGFEPGANANYSFSFGSLNSFDPTTYIMLQDLKENIMYNVRNGDYIFSADSADNWNRFILHFTPPAVISATDASCDNTGTISVTQPGSANWNYTLTGNGNATIATGVLNDNSAINLSAAPGTYTLTLVDNNNYTVIKTIQINGPSPVAAAFTASANNVSVQTPVNFTNTSQNANTYNWNFGDGATSALQNPAHAYATAGVYTVEMTAANSGGCSSDFNETITVDAGTTGIKEITVNGIRLWSNTNTVYVDFSQAGEVNAVIKIYDILGQELSEDKYTLNALFSRALLQLDAAYVIVEVNNDGAITTGKLFITNIGK